MIISRTPYRISFFGGGTDYPIWYQENGAAVLTSTINHYCYLHCRVLPPFFNHKYRIVWREVEEVSKHNQIKHPAVRAILEHLAFELGIEIHHQGDLPARSGLGSSSAFTVGLLNAIYALRGAMQSKYELASQAIHIERNILQENVGIQDQIETAFGGLNKIIIHPDGQFEVHPLLLPLTRLQELHDHLLLFFTGISRTASDIASDKIKAIPGKKLELLGIQQMVNEAIQILTNGTDLTDLGRLLHESWMLKRRISSKISTTFIDKIYSKALKAGALGGKLLGAGGGGCMLFFVKPENRLQLCKALKDLLLIPFEFEKTGSQIIHYDNLPYSYMAINRRDYLHLQDSVSDEPVKEEMNL